MLQNLTHLTICAFFLISTGHAKESPFTRAQLEVKTSEYRKEIRKSTEDGSEQSAVARMKSFFKEQYTAVAKGKIKDKNQRMYISYMYTFLDYVPKKVSKQRCENARVSLIHGFSPRSSYPEEKDFPIGAKESLEIIAAICKRPDFLDLTPKE